MRRRLLAGIVATAWMAGPGLAAAQADSLTDSLGPRAVGLGEALRAAAVGAAATRLNPAGISLVRSYSIETSVGLRPEDDATVAQAAICDSVTSRVGACVYYDYFGAEPTGGERRLHEVGLSLAMPLGERLSLGVTHKYVDYEESGSAASPMDGTTSGYKLDAGIVLKASTMLNIGVVGYNLVGDDEEQFPRGVGGGLALYPMPTLMVAADARWNLASDTARFGVGAEWFLSPENAGHGFPLRAGYVYDELGGASYATAGIGYVTPRIALDAGARKQVAGNGDELMLLIGLRLFLPN